MAAVSSTAYEKKRKDERVPTKCPALAGSHHGHGRQDAASASSVNGNTPISGGITNTGTITGSTAAISLAGETARREHGDASGRRARR